MKRSEQPDGNSSSRSDQTRSSVSAPAPGPSPSPSPSLKKSRQGEEGGNSVSGGSVTSNEALQKMAVDTDPSLLAQSMRSSVDSIDSSNSSTGNKSVVTGLVAAKSTPVPTKSPYDVAMSASKGGHGARIRLPDKLMEYLNNCVEPDVLWWQNEEGFAFDSTRVQKEFLDRHFEKTKLKSFIRSLNRWGFRRIFYHTLPKTIYTFSHPLFKRDDPELAKEMKMVSYSGQQQAEMEEFNRQRQEEVAAEQAPQATPVISQSLLQQQQQQQSTASHLSQQPYLSNPPGTIPGQLDPQHLLFLHQQQQQLQHQLAQQLDQQTIAQSGLLQSMLNIANQQPRVQQQPQQPVLPQLNAASRNLFFQSLLAGQQAQPAGPTGAPASNLQQQQQQQALAQILENQGRLDARQQQNLAAQYTSLHQNAYQDEAKLSGETSEKKKDQQSPTSNNQ